MNKKWIIIAAVAVAAYFVWRKFGGQIKDTISSATA
jgi:hypothetical protein